MPCLIPVFDKKRLMEWRETWLFFRRINL
uniref:Predicted protein n=1 Tax=Hordeum vulgare subsp. vulgare TaxID=112509 RepID=F2CYU2_HORVV|nr:predicted protein [Hordeum vulgare subsp. vulgare]